MLPQLPVMCIGGDFAAYLYLADFFFQRESLTWFITVCTRFCEDCMSFSLSNMNLKIVSVVIVSVRGVLCEACAGSRKGLDGVDRQPAVQIHAVGGVGLVWVVCLCFCVCG